MKKEEQMLELSKRLKEQAKFLTKNNPNTELIFGVSSTLELVAQTIEGMVYEGIFTETDIKVVKYNE